MDLNTALKVPGVELAAVCDLYTDVSIMQKNCMAMTYLLTNNYQEVLIARMWMQLRLGNGYMACTHN